MTILYSDPIFLKHDTGQHPECIARLVAITARLEAAGLVERCQRGVFDMLSANEVRRTHSPDMVQTALNTCDHGRGMLEPDTIVCSDSFEVALNAAGAGAAAVDAVMQGRDQTALCLVRPPGHHATPTRSMGFCLFNNIALAAQHARAKHGLHRILIVDWDVHHGNGTQDLFYDDPEVFFLSVHRYGHGFYPGTGDEQETGAGAGLGFTTNVPLPAGTPRDVFHQRFRNALEEAADTIKPDLVLVSAGFDAHHADPIGRLGLEAADFVELTQRVVEVAKTHAQGRLVSCLEGGYNLDALSECVQAHLETLLQS